MTYPCESSTDCVDGYSCLNGVCAAEAGEAADDDITGNNNGESGTDPETDPETEDTPQELVTPIRGTLACGDDFCCGIDLEGGLVCWGDNPGGPGTAESGIANQTTSNFDWITAQGNRFCGVTTEGAVECFGGGSPPENKSANVFTRVSASGNYACGIHAEGSECWGYDEPDAPTSLPTLTSISTAPYSACGLDPAGAITCWGSDTYSVPRSKWDQIAMTDRTQCGIADQQLYCWGDLNPLGAQSPVGDTFVALSVSDSYVDGFELGRGLCALTKYGAIDCSCCSTSGFNTDECSANENMDVCDDLPSPVGPFVQVRVGNNYACAMRDDGTVTCWGRGTENFDDFDSYNMEGQNAPSDVIFKTSRD
ncbi:MAG: hypothetical protein HOK97_11000 [Deltaproteobacteria bacterium]|jgi:hypothetical protein|nr:hypothetical protein [Deltaproteobacteria bacterium]MBT6490281.1 hypothetical protein [Deltaproteobacteria bacterium]